MNAQQTEILLVEDNVYDAELALGALRKVCVANAMHLAKDGAEALDFLFSGGASARGGEAVGLKVILLDLKLPKVSGFEVLQKVKSNDCTKSIPVVVLSSSTESRDIEESYRLGANSYVVKPVEFARFTRTLSDTARYWLQVNRCS